MCLPLIARRPPRLSGQPLQAPWRQCSDYCLLNPENLHKTPSALQYFFKGCSPPTQAQITVKYAANCPHNIAPLVSHA